MKRIITGIIAFSLVSWLIIKGSPLMFAIFICVASAIALLEYYQIVFSDQKQTIFSPITALGVLSGIVIVSAAYFHAVAFIFLVLIFNLMGMAVLSMPLYKKSPEILNVVEKVIQGVIYIPTSLSIIVLLRSDPDGITWIFFLLFMVFAGDTGALYSGKYLGRHKLSPSISPGKTIEGSIGGMLLAIIVGYVFVLLFLPQLNKPSILIFFVILNICGQAGDLFESQLKRVGNIKDSGNLLPGHGGILDRIDALLFAAPVAYVFKEFVLAGV
jgi:phosphatidate cytidylyltransferase